MYRIAFLILFVVSALIFQSHGWSGERTRDMMVNHFHLSLPKTDMATVYFREDSEFFLFPLFDNQDYIQICSGSWRADNHDRTVTLRGKNKCRLLNGTYRVSHQPDGLYLHNASKNFVLKHLN